MISALNVSSKCHVSFGNKHPELGRGIFCGGGAGLGRSWAWVFQGLRLLLMPMLDFKNKKQCYSNDTSIHLVS